MSDNTPSLAELGWSHHFSTQLRSDDEGRAPVRVIAVHRDRLVVTGETLNGHVFPLPHDPDNEESAATVGDWLMVDCSALRPARLLTRRSLFKRRAAGGARRVQLIAANVDTLFVVSSCNQDFSIARIERYLALAREADVTPVVVLTKADLTDMPETYVTPASRLLPGLLVETLDGRDPGDVAKLKAWCARGQTVALVGSSGVGKSTLINSLTGDRSITTQGIREDDSKGRHTTTGRELHRLPAGGWLVDTPGMRELGLLDAADGIASVFADIEAIAAQCRFSDCQHEGEPGCAVAAAIDSGDIEAARFKRWRKLAAEEAFNSESQVERRERSRNFGKMVKRVMKEKQSRRD